ncbi:MAG: ATP-binding protein, partial [Candidatus Aenigmatarchaeota archaeon]
MERELREIFLEWKEFELPEIIERKVKAKISDQILAIVGPRRAGKTYFM